MFFKRRSSNDPSASSSRRSLISVKSIDTTSTSSWRSSNSHSSAATSSPTTSISTNSRVSTWRKGNASPTTPSSLAPKALPQDVYDNILYQLQLAHSNGPVPSCVTCYVRDLHALGLTCRAWDRAVRAKLYNCIHITGPDSSAQQKKYKTKQGSRLRLLRRTLRERKMLANLVHELRVPDFDGSLVLPGGRSNPHLDEYRNLVASVVMACPNLERLLGLHTPYNHDFDRLTQALSTRKNLKEHVWVITEPNSDIPETSDASMPGVLQQDQIHDFLHYHSGWQRLETLMLYSPFDGAISHEMFVEIFARLPGLRHVCVSSFDPGDFHNETLQALPPLCSLRLENVPGITDTGLTRYTSRPSSKRLTSLSLIQLNVAALETITRILSTLPVLRRFVISQSGFSPMLPSEDDIIFQPILASPSLKYLHWDVPPPDWFGIAPVQALSMSNLKAARASIMLGKADPKKDMETPNSLLAQSITSGGFPGLLSLRAPNDVSPPGALQGVCRPTPKGEILEPADKYSLPPGARGMSADLPEKVTNGNRLQLARIRAQNCINRAPKEGGESMKVVITYHSDSYGSLSDLANLAQAQHDEHFEDDENDTTTDESDDGSWDGAYDEEGMFFSNTDEEGEGIRPTKKIAKRRTLESSSSRNTSPDLSMTNIKSTLSTSAASHAITVHEFSLPAFLGRVYSTTVRNEDVATMPPKFHLLPDIPGHEAEGGLVDWRLLLKPELIASGLGAVRTSLHTDDRSSSVPNLTELDLSGRPRARPVTRNGVGRSGSGDTYSTSSSTTSARPLSSWGLGNFSSSGKDPKNDGVSSNLRNTALSTDAARPSTSYHASSSMSRDTCTGNWNSYHQKGRDWFSHTERERGWATYEIISSALRDKDSQRFSSVTPSSALTSDMSTTEEILAKRGITIGGGAIREGGLVSKIPSNGNAIKADAAGSAQPPMPSGVRGASDVGIRLAMFF